MKNKIIRCSNTVKIRDGGDRRCSAFIAEVDDFKITTSCRKCGTEYVISRDALGSLRIHGVPKGKRLIDLKENKK